MYSFVTIFVRSNMQIEDYSFNDTNRENEVHQIVGKHQWIHKTDYYNYTVSRKKTRHQTLGHNFSKYYPIFKFFSLADSAVNLQQIHV